MLAFLLGTIIMTSDDECSHTERPDSNQTQQPVNALQPEGRHKKIYVFIITITTIMTTINAVIVRWNE